jgi:hypothetical protein
VSPDLFRQVLNVNGAGFGVAAPLLGGLPMIVLVFAILIIASALQRGSTISLFTFSPCPALKPVQTLGRTSTASQSSSPPAGPSMRQRCRCRHARARHERRVGKGTQGRRRAGAARARAENSEQCTTAVLGTHSGSGGTPSSGNVRGVSWRIYASCEYSTFANQSPFLS